ncbi:conserved hypothetical protein [Uncinocarpus reesii 1704]|uniref:Mannosyltransferase n=1 Tax=Uncinocarpus reesii (strain UAMH 1704) TaxID=336963 RepID=C4JKS6_UNCRE|nr:uncharacterized protein UREG_00622 [Uncinocarpus reesii 1704]EEP75775.1 conserved hypothetical protein [Uncinocarpus reesii 1704]
MTVRTLAIRFTDLALMLESSCAEPKPGSDWVRPQPTGKGRILRGVGVTVEKLSEHEEDHFVWDSIENTFGIQSPRRSFNVLLCEVGGEYGIQGVPFLISVHLVLSPYTKVEESFNIQAVHDILRYGIPSKNIPKELRENYDHFTFPGAVPRTFVGALLLAGVARPLIWINAKLQSQLLVRGILGAFNAVALMFYARAVRRAFGKEAGVWYILLQASQFHVIYYASRTLPNMFAFGIMFRSEIALLLGTITVYHWLQGNISIRREIVPAGVSGVLIALLVSVPIDSFFWQRFPLWPELSAFFYNVVSGKASDWGVHPWHFYLTSAIPRLLLNPLAYIVAIPMSFVPARRHAALSLLTPSLAFIALIKNPHGTDSCQSLLSSLP